MLSPMQTMLTLVMMASVAHTTGLREKVTPVQKVLEMLQGMLEKGKKGKHEEQVQYAAYRQFCDGTTVEKQKAIKEANEMIEMLKADIQQFEADAELLTKEIGVHQEDLAVLSGDMKAATKAREIERVDYDKTHQDYSESVDALERAITVLKKQNFDRTQASLTQVSDLKKMNMIPKEAKRAIDVFLAQDDREGLTAAAPEANAYEFQSQGIIDMLQKLLDKFVDERVQLEKEETSKRHSYEMLMQDLGNQEEEGKAAIDHKSTIKAKKLQKKADAEGTLKDTTATRDDDLKYLEDLVATCQKKSGDFQKRQELRAEEVAAIEKAIEIISSDAVAGNAEKHLPGLLQKKKVMLTQLRADGRSPDQAAQARVAQYLKERADELDSRVLSAIAVRADADPFKKVIKMIKDLITRLEEEAAEEADHKAWCDTELETNGQTRSEKTEAVETLHAEIDRLEASIAKLTEEISELSKAVADIDAAVAEATSMREQEKTKNSETIKDAEEAQTAVAQAVSVLKEFYAKAADATVLMQKKKQPEVFDEAYKGMQTESGGVVAMLEVIQSDFARLQSETEASEEAAQSEYDEFMTDSAADKAQKEKDIDHKASKKQDQSQQLQTNKGDLELTQKELDAALAYYEKLKPSCVDAGVSYDDRVARRKEEIQSLQEALKILNGEDIA
eukprot:gnl/MRDRNA2_/MRDRNA2_89339_c0_seq1.p1 gnl/MRDRNA2_/MRDRNA2_89339_c0~~gnl/MRDRNA2_/MRDRNA2_89339_c0_seq1.p1  ORF type:complete len:675 (+),score=238.87 gnl/MRDRNA2_/MRDRNA2_89339_c0_seq1:72-2096(+)